MNAPRIEYVRLRPVSPTLAFCDVRLPGVLLHGLRVEVAPDGSLKVTPPERQDSKGRLWPLCTLQPAWREAVDAEVGRLWAEAARRTA